MATRNPTVKAKRDRVSLFGKFTAKF